MKGRIKGSTEFEVSSGDDGLLSIEVIGLSSPSKIRLTPEQASALAAFIRETEAARLKSFRSAYWSK